MANMHTSRLFTREEIETAIENHNTLKGIAGELGVK